MTTPSPLASVEAGRGEREALERAAKIADDWLEVFADKPIKHVSAQQYAADAVRDIAEQIRALQPLLQGNGGEAVAWQKEVEAIRELIWLKTGPDLDPKCITEAHERLGKLLYAAPSSPPEGVREALKALVEDIQISMERWQDSNAGPATAPAASGPLPDCISQEAWEQALAALTTTTPSRGLAAEWHENMAATLRRNTQRFNEEWSETTYRDEEYNEARADIRRDEVKAIFHENSAAALRTLSAKGTAP